MWSLCTVLSAFSDPACNTRNGTCMTYDLAVAGGGIAGLYLGWKCAEAGMKVCIIEGRRTIGLPVRCGEATGNERELARFIPVDPRWIACELEGLAVHFNGAAPMVRRIEQTGVVLRRDRFELQLYENASVAGATIMTGTTVSGLCAKGGNWSGLCTSNGSRITATLIAGADGPQSLVGREAGITAVLAARDAFPALQYRVDAPGISDRMLHFHLGTQIIPRGYLWVFPRADGQLSVGAGTFGAQDNPALPAAALETFLARHFPGAPRSHLVCGCAPITVCPGRLFRGNVTVVGDAARQVNPLTAGGIMNTLEAADLLWRSIVAASGDPHRAFLRYNRVWCARPRREQFIFMLLKELFLQCNDNEIERTLRGLDCAFASQITRDTPFCIPGLRLLRALCPLVPRIAMLALHRRR